MEPSRIQQDCSDFFSSEQPLDEDNWKTEAQAVIRDVETHVKDIHVSPKLSSTNKRIYLNIMTLEEQKLCVELSAPGFRIVGNDFDDKSNPQGPIYETPYSILDSVSPKYRDSFGNSLLNKLEDLKETLSVEDDEVD